MKSSWEQTDHHHTITIIIIITITIIIPSPPSPPSSYLLREPPEDGRQLLMIVFARLEPLPRLHNLSQPFKHGGWSKAPQESGICLFLKLELGNSWWGGEQNTTMGQGP